MNRNSVVGQLFVMPNSHCPTRRGLGGVERLKTVADKEIWKLNMFGISENRCDLRQSNGWRVVGLAGLAVGKTLGHQPRTWSELGSLTQIPFL